MQAVENDDLQTVQRLLASEQAVVTERCEGGWTAALLAAGLGHFRLLEWLLTEGGADILEVDKDGDDVWSTLKDKIELAEFGYRKPADDDELSSLLRVMSLLGDAPPEFNIDGNGFNAPFLKPHHAQIVALGQRLRARLPSYLEQQHALIAHHTPIPAVLQPLVAKYATPTPEDMWAWE
jgi:hypothetical protein